MISENLKSLLSKENLDLEFRDLLNCIESENTLYTAQSIGEKVHLATQLNKFVVYVAKDSYQALSLLSKFRNYLGDQVDFLRPNDDVLVFRRNFQNENATKRAKVLNAILQNKLKVLIVTPQSLVQYLPNKNRLSALIKTIKVNQDVDMYKLAEDLVKLGYRKEDVVEEKNTFSISGDNVSIFLADMESPIRVSFWGDTIESIKTYDLQSMMSIAKLEEISLYPNNDLLLTEDEIENAINLVKKELPSMNVSAGLRIKEILSDLILEQTCSQKMQWLMPFILSAMNTLYSYIPKDSQIIFDDITQIGNVLRDIKVEHKSRVDKLCQDGEVTKKHLSSLINVDELKIILSQYTILGFSLAITSSYLYEPKKLLKSCAVRMNNYNYAFESLARDIKTLSWQDYMVIVCLDSNERAFRVADSLKQAETPCTYVEHLPNKWQSGVFVTHEDLDSGFNYPKSKLFIIGIEDLHKKKSSSEKKNKNRVFVMPKVGDYVVHETIGIGRCLGTNRVKTGRIEQDYILVEYKNGAILYIPVDQMDLLSRYSGSDSVPKLSSIDGSDFSKLKETVKKSIKKMAINLVELYAKRETLKGYTYSKDDELMRDFEESFEYEPTDDQIDAIMDIKSDMENGVLMDRLLCGDVGYGKTEVALRAAFKTIENGKQVAILAPTTILAHQHYKTAFERFKEYGIDIELATRLRTKNEIQESMDNIASGKSSMLIGTHKILNKNWNFQDLGLLILDEEQRFGVEHKEKLKQRFPSLNVLTLSATPIPRTLNMSLIGVRDISVLETPPSNRLAVQTSVVELTDALLEDCIERELSRGGQVFILYNHVDSIELFAEHIKELSPNAQVTFAHGQMSSEMLEDRINSFYDKKTNVLVCTTIIENGIDIPDANTLIVCDADKLGLSQLYQLRGRVGRSNRIAYAYFTVNQGKVLTSDASKRLSAIMDYTELGSGFKIAMRDLEIRGAGNILGREQHGHIEKVGYDLYCKMLQETIGEIQGKELTLKDCKMEVAVNAYLDKDYVDNDNARLAIYRDILDIQNKEDEIKLIRHLEQSFGNIPTSVTNLIDIGLSRNIAKQLDIALVRVMVQETSIIFNNANFLNNELLMNNISNLKDIVSIKNEARPKICFDLKNMDNVRKLQFIKNLLLDSVQ